MTRAILSLLTLDFSGYFAYNAMAIFVLSDIILLLFEKKIRHKRLFYSYLVLNLTANLIYYVLRLTNGTIL